MQNLLSKKKINQFQKDGAVFIKGKFDKSWIEKLRNGIDIDINNPSPRFVNHTKDSDLPGYHSSLFQKKRALLGLKALTSGTTCL